MSKRSHFDYIIIGNGLAGLQLALRLSEDTFFKDKRIALIDPSEKNENDKTWSFWKKDASKWSSIIHKSWSNASVITSNNNIHLNLNPYTYNSIRAIDFYAYTKSKLESNPNLHFIIDTVIDVTEKDTITVKTKTSQYSATHIFDSRIPSDFFSEANTSINIIQHFKGWIIHSEKDVFDDNSITMMDYRLKDANQTTFMYVLPFSKNDALVEFTYFTKQIVSKDVYDSFLKTYVKDFLKIDSYTISEVESGQIPMTNFNFSKYNTKNITKIGTAGGWVKGSTGYSFTITEQKIDTILTNLKSNTIPSKGLFKRKYRFYDKIFLKVLADENHKGEWIFEHFYGKNSTQTMFRFLDEESSFLEDLKIMWSLFSWSFIKAFF